MPYRKTERQNWTNVMNGLNRKNTIVEETVNLILFLFKKKLHM